MRTKNGLSVQALACWNWKCALMSATVRSSIYLLAMTRSGAHACVSLVLVEMAYVSLTAGVYAGMQQRALGLRSPWLGNSLVVIGVPGFAQLFEWLTHRAVGPAAPARAIVVSGIFTLISALFHLHVMRRGVFLTGDAGRTLAHDLRRIPRLVLDFVLYPYQLISTMSDRILTPSESET